MGTELLVGGRIYSPSSPDATAMAVTDGTVVWVGADRPGRALHPEAEVVELDGAFVAPAFVDAHVHTTALGLRLTGLDLSPAASLDECLALLRTFAGNNDGFVWGHGWDETRWQTPHPPSAAAIEQIAPGRLVYLSRVDSHSAACSPALLAAAGVDARDGIVRADEHHRVRQVALARLDRAQRDRARQATLDRAAAMGVAAIHECAGPDITGVDDLRELLACEHGVEVRAYWGEAAESVEHATDLLERTGADGLAGDLFVDGSLGSRTAWLHQPYDDGAGIGNSYLEPETVVQHIKSCTVAGIQAGFHVIGDAAVTCVVDAFEAVVRELGGPTVAACGHRLEHVEMISAEQAGKLGAWGVIASVQPGFDAAWGGEDGMYATRLGADRARSMNPFATMAGAGVPLALGSDAPVTALRPWAAVRAAVHHRTPGSGISPRAAFTAATKGAWRAGGVRDGVAGSLAAGAPASYAVWDTTDLVVAAPKDAVQRWSTDPRAGVPPLPRLDPGSPEPACLRTVHRGTVIHEA